MIIINIVMLPVLLVVNFIKVLRKSHNYDFIINVVAIIQCIYWLGTAPHSRYGEILLFLIPCMLIVHIIENNPKIIFSFYPRAILTAMGIMLICFICRTITVVEKIPLKRSSYYVRRECDELEWEGITMYTPIENCNTGYYCFPGLTYPGRLPYLELRGDTIQDGFRIKEEYKHINLTTYGTIIE